jgi:hypothetical protein
MSSCSVPGCNREAPSRAHTGTPHCNTHKSHFRRHGHPTQRAVTVAELRPYLGQVEASVARNPESSVWAVCRQRWEGLVKIASDINADARAGKPGIHATRVAAWELLTVAKAGLSDEVWKTVAAMHLLHDASSTRFRSDQAFRVQVSRRVRCLTERNAGRWFNAKTGRTARVYRDPSPRGANILGQWLCETFGEVGIRIATTLKAEANKLAKERVDFHAALSALT